MVPHAADLIQNWLKEVSQISVDGSGQMPDVCLVEVPKDNFSIETIEIYPVWVGLGRRYGGGYRVYDILGSTPTISVHSG